MLLQIVIIKTVKREPIHFVLINYTFCIAIK